MSAPVDRVPFTGSFPAQPPEAVQAVALLDDHDNVAALALDTVLGLALRETLGAGEVTETVVD